MTRVMKARKITRCPVCLAAMTNGQLIAQPSPDAPWQHATCLIATRALPPGAATPGGSHAHHNLPVSEPANQEPVHGGGSRPTRGDPALPAPSRPRVGADHVQIGGT